MGLLGRVEIRGVVLFLIFRYRVVFLESFFLSILSFIGFSMCFLMYAIGINFSLLRLFVGIMYLKDNSPVFLLLYAKRCKGAVWGNPFKLSSTEGASREGSLREVRSFYIYRCNRGV